MKHRFFVTLVVVPVLLAAERLPAQVDQVADGTLFIDATDGAWNVTITRNDSVLAALTFPKGTIMSAVDEHRNPQRLDGGRYEFHGHFEVRAMPPGDAAAAERSGAKAAAELLYHAPMVMVIKADGVDVILEPAAR